MSKGIPKLGDRGAWDVDNYGTVHASDIASGDFVYHLPDGADVDQVPVWDGSNWVPGAGGGAGAGGTVIWYDEGILAGTAVNANITGDGGTVTVAGGTATLNITTPDHDHSGDAGDGGTFDAANLTSGVADDGYVLTADGAGGAAWEASGGGGGGTTIWYDEGVIAGTASNVNITGTGGTVTVTGGTATINISGAADTDAIHVDEANEISALDLKATPADDDVLIIEDSAAGYVKKKILVSSLVSVGGAFLTQTTIGGNFLSLVITLVETAIEA